MDFYGLEPPAIVKKYVYECELVKVVDGDTVKLRVDCGFNITFTDNFRLSDIDAPEMRGPGKEAGAASKEFLIKFLEGKKLLIESLKYRGKYGRYIVRLQADDAWANDTLVKEGHAKYRKY